MLHEAFKDSAYYPHDDGGTEISVAEPQPAPNYHSEEMLPYITETLLDNLHRLAPADADCVDAYYCWAQSGLPRIESLVGRMREIFFEYGFDCAHGWSAL